MSKGNTFENDLLKAIFWGTAIANLLDNAAASPNTSLYFALHTADPAEGGSQNTNECTYGDYARVAVARTNLGFNISGNTVTLVNDVDFPVASSGSQTATHFSIGMASSGAGKILYKGALSPNIVISTGVPPTIRKETTITED